MNKQPLVSVIVPCHNSARFVNETIQSVLNQTYPNWELILIDDCSMDNTLSILRAYKSHPKVSLYSNSKNIGVSETRNSGIEVAQGEYIAFLDSDDVWLPTKLEKQLEHMVANHAQFSCTSYEIMDENGTPLKTLASPPEVIGFDDLVKQNVVGCSTVIVDKNLLKDFKFENIGNEDFGLWLKILQTGIVCRSLQEPMVRYRLVSGSRSSAKLKSAKNNWWIYRNCLKLPFNQALNYFSQYAVRSLIKHLRLNFLSVSGLFRASKQAVGSIWRA